MGGFSEPVFGVFYGPSGWGKTTDMLFSFPQALFIAAKGALKPWVEVVGLPYAPATTSDPKTIQDATNLIQQISKEKKRKYNAIVVDDLSLMADRTWAEAEKKFSGHPLWGEIRRQLLNFRDAARDAGLHILMTAHERNPHNDDKKGFVRGGPMLPGTMPEDMPKACDTVFRVGKEDAFPMWPFVYHCDETSTQYVQKDRHGLTPKVAPMNVGEILRVGYGQSQWPILRAVGLEWMEESVEKLANAFAGHLPHTPEHAELRRKAMEQLLAKKTKDTRHVYWVIRDATARALLRKTRRDEILNRIAAVPVVPGVSGGGSDEELLTS